MTPPGPPPALPGPRDPDAFYAALQQIGEEARRSSGPGDLAHLRKVSLVAHLCSLVGWLTAWIAPNPLSVLALSTGLFARWTMIGHHVSHRGYDRLSGGDPGLLGRSFAEGWRRYQWPDWLVPAAWKHEHNQLHHYRLNEARDPDLVEENLRWLRESGWPMPLRWLVVLFAAMTWKWSYYAPNTLAELHRADDPDMAPPGAAPRHLRTWSPLAPAGRALWLQSLLPVLLLHFALPAAICHLLAPWLGPQAVMAALINRGLAEILTNLHSFLVIVPNHAGDDIYRFDRPTSSKPEFLLRQILGSANFHTGGPLNDFLHGYLNYQIEHHLWPDLPMAAIARAQPRVRDLCAQHGVPYVQHSVWHRLRKTIRVMVGAESMMLSCRVE